VTEDENIGPTEEALGSTPVPEKPEPSIESVFAAQHATAIALRTSTTHFLADLWRPQLSPAARLS
jgi:hypothetical protein